MVTSTMSSRFGEGFRRPSDREDIACFSRGQLGLIVLFIGFGAAAYGKGFRIYSAATILILLVFGALAGAKAPQAAQFSAPWMGAMERLSYYSYLLWILVLAIALLRAQESSR